MGLMSTGGSSQSEPFFPPGDYMIAAHVREDSTESTFQVWPAEEARPRGTYFVPRYVRDVLVEAILGCKRHMEYSTFHNAYLIGQVTNEEFAEISARFAVTASPDTNMLADKIATLLEETGTDFPPEQLEEMFSARGNQVSEAIKTLSARGLVRLHV